MAGVVAMASVIEDFDPQPCKKSRKDASSPVVKTITNYFSPVTKAMEKPFSPPRSNNIMDYFSRKTPSSNEKTSPGEQPKEKHQTSQSAGAAAKPPSQKRGRRTTKAARKLVDVDPCSSPEEVSCLHKESNEIKDKTAKTFGVLGSETASLLAQISADTCNAVVTRSGATVDVENAEIGEHHKADSAAKIKKTEPELNCLTLSPVVLSKDKENQLKNPLWNSRKHKIQEAEQPQTDEKDVQSPLCNVSMEVNISEDSQLNNSTVTISFEDFVRSQSRVSTEEDIEVQQDEEDANENVEEEKINDDMLDNSKTPEDLISCEPLLQVSPRTLTIQAEVHVLSAKQEVANTVGKLASIFTKRKGASSIVEEMPSYHAKAEPQPPCTPLPVKRKSNVVLQEEDLELAVLESESFPKSSEAERKQFMSAFKQPCRDGSKTKPGKNQGKQKQSDATDNNAEDDATVSTPSEEVPSSSQENNATKKRPAKKGKKKINKKEEEAASTVSEETGTTIDKKEEIPTSSVPSIPAVRRSRREVVIRNASESTPANPTRNTRKLSESKVTAAPAVPDSTATMSTPKTRKSKHGVFVAEMVCPPDTKESPIRMKFTRLQRNVSPRKSESGSDLSPSLNNKTKNKSEKRKQAKKLVEKAKVIQQSKKTCEEEKGTLRRSSRNEASIKRSYCEDEDSIICLEDNETQTVTQKSKTTKTLRSLNDVLGKASSTAKETKSAPGSKVALLSQEKNVRKVSIFDESSHEGSENSQDDEQFKARREFLKSGLPESFKKQIAKTAATKEAYSLSCSYFQPVTHMKQSTDCSLWSLPWPESSLLSHLRTQKEGWSQAFSSVASGTSSFCLKTKPAGRTLCKRSSGWRPEVSESVRQRLMEEISTSNPSFPVQMFLTRFLKRRADHHRQHCTDSETPRATDAPLPAEPVGGKRKRMDDGENTVKMAKKQRANNSQETILTAEPESTKHGGRKRRTQRSRLEAKEEAARANETSPLLSKDDSVIILDDLLLGEDSAKNGVVKEDVLWTEKYQPQHSSDIIGNNGSVRRLHSWLREWKLRADREERKKQKDKKQEEGSNDSDWDYGEEDSQDGEDTLCNTMLITGPTGVGKTAAVYACAQELGFKVFEVNASSQRSGRLILSQLKEATQSHQVDSQGVNAHKPTYFNSYSTSSSAGSLRPGSSPRKVNSPRRVVSSPRKHPQSPRGAKRGSLAPTSLVNFFKMGRPTNKQLPITTKNEQSASSKKVVKENECVSKNKDLWVTSPTASAASDEQSKKMATSLILFEEVDVIFDDDSGFLAAIKTFMMTTKRPVILTTSDPLFGAAFDGSFEEIHFKTPSLLNVGSYLQLLCLAEDTWTDLSDISALLKLNGCNIRQSLLQLQFWTRSAGGRQTTTALTQNELAEHKPETDGPTPGLSVPSTLPLCDTGCTESRLGLFNIEPERDIWEVLKGPVEEAVCKELLTDSRRRGVDLLYSNMETLLPLPHTQLTMTKHKLPSTCLQAETLPSKVLHAVESADGSDDGSPVKVSFRMKNKRRHCLSDEGGLLSDSDSEDGFLSLRKSHSDSQTKEEVKESLFLETVKRKPLTPEERVKGLLVSQCLESLAEFLDNMSYMDSSLLAHPERGDIYRMSPIGAAVKDGMTDDPRIETNRESWFRGGHVLAVQAAVESLSFHRCRTSVADTWDKTQKLEGELRKEAETELTLPVASHCKGYSFTQVNPCQPQLVQERRDVMESLLLKNLAGTLGNRAAAAQDFLPALRTICRSEQLKEEGKVKRRFLHYLDAIHLGLDKKTLQHLAKDFP